MLVKPQEKLSFFENTRDVICRQHLLSGQTSLAPEQPVCACLLGHPTIYKGCPNEQHITHAQ